MRNIERGAPDWLIAAESEIYDAFALNGSDCQIEIIDHESEHQRPRSDYAEAKHEFARLRMARLASSFQHVLKESSNSSIIPILEMTHDVLKRCTFDSEDIWEFSTPSFKLAEVLINVVEAVAATIQATQILHKTTKEVPWYWSEDFEAMTYRLNPYLLNSSEPVPTENALLRCAKSALQSALCSNQSGTDENGMDEVVKSMQLAADCEISLHMALADRNDSFLERVEYTNEYGDCIDDYVTDYAARNAAEYEIHRTVWEDQLSDLHQALDATLPSTPSDFSPSAHSKSEHKPELNLHDDEVPF